MAVTFQEPPFWADERSSYRFAQHVGLSLITPPTTEPLSIADVKAHLNLDDTTGEPSPASAPTLALAAAGAGSMENGAHRLALSYVTADGETAPGPLSAPVTVADKTTNGKITVSAIAAGGSNVTTIKFWKPLVGTVTPLFYAGSVANGVTSTTLNLADASLGVQAPTVNTTVDVTLSAWITAARQFCEAYTDRAFITQTWQLTLNNFPMVRGLITIPKPPLLAVTSIGYVDASGVAQSPLDPLTYTVDAPAGPYAGPGRILPVYGTYYWPFPPAIQVLNGVTVTFNAGYGGAAAVPAPLKQAMKLLIGNWFTNREAAQLIRGSADILPFGVEPLLAPFCQVGIA